MSRRSYLTLLLLLNYLLVVGAGFVERPVPMPDRPFDYAHSADCQLQHTLKVACFDDCNGVQYTLHKPGEKPPLHELLNTLKRLDMHCLFQLPLPTSSPSWVEADTYQLSRTLSVRRGFGGAVYSPPRWG